MTTSGKNFGVGQSLALPADFLVVAVRLWMNSINHCVDSASSRVWGDFRILHLGRARCEQGAARVPGYALGWKGLANAPLILLFFFASRDSLRKYYERTGSLLGPDAPLIETTG